MKYILKPIIGLLLFTIFYLFSLVMELFILIWNLDFKVFINELIDPFTESISFKMKNNEYMLLWKPDYDYYRITYKSFFHMFLNFKPIEIEY